MFWAASAAFALLVATVAWLGIRDVATGRSTPQEAAGDYLDALVHGDWGTVWTLLCRPDQLRAGPRERYAYERGAESGGVSLSALGVDVDVGDVRYDGETSSHAVKVQLSGGQRTERFELTVVEEQDEFRVCEEP
ncbi:hypothetical protein GCU56_04145 [Geodermatophilus sabuli]|uniref:DUF4878 domain-containing protein n=1 Tax=Geodermatophilus sabuli TaxID=1564158 RepID=A0A7K3VY79_9ACTN|nr:hypothetical protein [Geodermatophilus sabuli]NEK57063.1 hypothetical protein [Geodermatophilus sabuli]